jgi:hypothetical protein
MASVSRTSAEEKDLHSCRESTADQEPSQQGTRQDLEDGVEHFQAAVAAYLAKKLAEKAKIGRSRTLMKGS